MTGSKTIEKNALHDYNESVVKGVEAGVAFLKKWPQLGFTFNTNAQGGLVLGPQPANVATIIAEIDKACGGLSLSSANLVFGQLVNDAIEQERWVTRFKIGDQHITEITPVVG